MTGADDPLIWLSPAQVCELVPGMTERRLRGLRANGAGPRYYKPSLKTVIYERSEIEAWIRGSVHTTRDHS
ncbi:helix-turn-helix transcriptional regulator [Microbacterium phosphatis]|uniref:helix-turn-helix transcriptional regulator n=1 Tax=Microbacterium phosphatis TaxID=3140248 RepID=UPI00314070A1